LDSGGYGFWVFAFFITTVNTKGWVWQGAVAIAIGTAIAHSSQVERRRFATAVKTLIF